MERKAHYVDYLIAVQEKDGSETFLWKVGEVVDDKTIEVSDAGITVN